MFCLESLFPRRNPTEKEGEAVIREICPEDYAVVAGFWRDILNFPSATDESVSRTFEKMSKDSRYCTYVAEEDSIVVGFITLVEVLSIEDPDGYFKINGIAVAPEYQNRGIGRQLIAFAEETAKERGANSIGVASTFKRTGMHSLLDGLGYEKSAFWFHKIIDLK